MPNKITVIKSNQNMLVLLEPPVQWIKFYNYYYYLFCVQFHIIIAFIIIFHRHTIKLYL